MYMIVFGLSSKLIQEMRRVSYSIRQCPQQARGIADGLVQNVSSDSQHVSEDERSCLNGRGVGGVSVGAVEGQGEGSWGHDFKMVTSTSIVTLMRRGLGYVGQSRILNTRKN